MRGRQAVEQEILGLKFTAQPLPFPQAQSLLAEVGMLLSLVVRELGPAVARGIKSTDDVTVMLPVLVPVMEHLGQGRLERLAPKLLACTTVVVPDITGALTRHELMKEADRNAVFDDYPETYLPALFFAGKVTFGRFFPGSALRTLGDQAKQGDSEKTGSSPST